MRAAVTARRRADALFAGAGASATHPPPGRAPLSGPAVVPVAAPIAVPADLPAPVPAEVPAAVPAEVQAPVQAGAAAAVDRAAVVTDAGPAPGLVDAAVGRWSERSAGPAEGGAGGSGGEAPEDVPGPRERWRLGLRDRVPLWLRTRCGMEPRTVVALTVVLVVATALAGRHFWAGRPETVRAPEVVEAAPAAAGPAGGAPRRAGAGAPPVVVDVSGKVRRPGVLRLPAGSRVADALRAAGGAGPGTDLTGLNRARVVMDGEHIVVGVTPPPAAAGPGSGVTGDAGASGPGGGAGPVSLTTATAEQLDALPGVGPVLAQHIVEYRTRHGGFRSVDELREVNGIGERRFADLQPLVRP
ncbi:helix-hairpin-helix domain-containing protein [Streptomyces sp. NPDC016309]|uniref:helix-hairpin-helix domain-containing protein n=1 Tax=Streptomyces sp. NPDC016309 TaxID=3364965 RepID=UPI0036FFEFE4